MLENTSTLILALVSFLQLIFIFILKRVFETQDNTFKLIANNHTLCRDRLEKDRDDAKIDRDNMKKEYTALLDKHYVTNGQLSTLEEKLTGQIKQLAMAIDHLTDAIKASTKLTNLN